MKTCDRFASIKSGFEQDIRFLREHAQRHSGSSAAKASARHALGVRQNMARALSRHYTRCLICS
ncbi:hypothetical protein [Streptomyces sp. BPTC-684]|uniref:hypothetical protein n=1 Tax=Streptomyces sp. BPTC-684 TaxID=3043734 RepID=UPI0024B1099A|nr:hypothetical protein [Streptomyces sp. BPTC-684]WHM36615.1 hypothetical protein QIY60_06450 [Streptomyces sp. BPTC-684]